ncbi:thymic stromal lymphopoietin [Diceros bicornis minor]|uniref:thymic stromal lymphopoietin n=1 Tax=Diceros bicornis minor TaxID=77932 RepID=UPI0026F2F3FC|nr:thymic stromal lymphopoietin [Diceros bicornis minor]
MHKQQYPVLKVGCRFGVFFPTRKELGYGNGSVGERCGLPDALLFVLSVFFRKIFILQLVGLVLTYNFADCDFEKIREKYQKVIFPALEGYMSGIKSTESNHTVYCGDRPGCLAEIKHLTFSSTQECPLLAKEILTKTNAILTHHCPGYSGIQINNTQAMKKRKKREVTANKCLTQVSNLIELWRHFSRFRRNKSSLKSYFTATK